MSTPAVGHTTMVGLFATCPVGGCANLVADPRQVCPACRAAFGDYLRPATGLAPDAEAFAADIARADRRAREVLVARRPQAKSWKANQRCWVCETRRTCRQEHVGVEARWVCRTCEAIV